MNHDDLGNYSHTEVRNLRQQIADLQKQLATERERADYAWRNANVIEKARQEEMCKRDELLAAAANGLAALVTLNDNRAGLCNVIKEIDGLRAAIAKVKP